MKSGIIWTLVSTLSSAVYGQRYPTLPSQTCTAQGCTTQSTSIVFDASFNLQPSQYAANGVTISGNSITLTLKNGDGPRVYLAANDWTYRMFTMPGNEITYDVETSQLDCQMVGSLYFAQMPANGAAGGTGYCDANCIGGSCCAEMDLWEANKYSTVMTVHPSGSDPWGCGINPYASISRNLYGPGSNYQVDTTQKFTVTTQFIQNGWGQVSEIRRIYQQNGRTIQGGSLTTQCNVAGMGSAMAGGSVLAFSIWSSPNTAWLDQGNNGPCPTGSLSSQASMTYSNIRYGPIGTTTTATCGTQETNIDFYGDDITSLPAASPAQCCNACSSTSGCAAYTFAVNYCYLKRSSDTRQVKSGAISATVQQCSTKEWGWCGNPSTGAQCCPSNQYCQPWDVNFFQCIPKPAKCSTLFPQVDFYGNDIKTVYGVSPWDCCEQCSNTPGCKAYTFVNDNKNTPACYLKTGTGARRSHVTAVSGVLN